jgi:ABC transporter
VLLLGVALRVGELLADLAQPWPLALVINDIGRPAEYLPVFRHPRGERPLPAAGRVNRRGDPGGGCRAGDGVHSRTARRAGHPHRGIGLSGGQRQRVGIARALLLDTLVVLLEEPTTGLNKVAEEVVAQALTCIVHLTTASSTTRRWPADQRPPSRTGRSTGSLRHLVQPRW